MVEYAEWSFDLSTSQDQATKLEHLEQVERQTGRTPKELEGPDFPISLEYLWSAFFSLSSARTSGFSGPNPITYQEIKAWKELTQTPLSARDVEAVKRLDLVYMRVMNG